MEGMENYNPESTKRLFFNTFLEFETFMSENKRIFTDRIVDSVREGIKKKSRSVLLFELELESHDNVITTSLTKSEWKDALEKCIEYYREENEVDLVIDTWELLQKIK